MSCYWVCTLQTRYLFSQTCLRHEGTAQLVLRRTLNVMGHTLVYSLNIYPSMYSGTSIIRTPLGSHQTVLTMEVSLVRRLCKPHPWISRTHLHYWNYSNKQKKFQRRPGRECYLDIWHYYLHDDPCGTATLALAIELGGVAFPVL